jgi:hypothetical protein
MLEEQILEQKDTKQDNIDFEWPKSLFTRSRILFLIVVFIVMCIPLIYRYFSYLLK